MRYLITIFGEETLQSILSTLPNTYGFNMSTYFRIESEKLQKMVICGYFLVPFYYCNIVDVCIFEEDMNFDHRRCKNKTVDKMPS